MSKPGRYLSDIKKDEYVRPYFTDNNGDEAMLDEIVSIKDGEITVKTTERTGSQELKLDINSIKESTAKFLADLKQIHEVYARSAVDSTNVSISDQSQNVNNNLNEGATIKKGNLATLTAEQAAEDTPEASSGTVSRSNITQPNAGVNNYLSKPGRYLSDIERDEYVRPYFTDNNGDEAVLDKIVSIKDGEITVKTTERTGSQELKLDINSIKDGTARELYSAASEMTKETAKLFLNNYDGADVGTYKQAFDYFFESGRTGMDIERIREYDSMFGRYFSAEAQEEIARAGLESREFREGVTDLSVGRKDRGFKAASAITDAIGKRYSIEFIFVDTFEKSDGSGANGLFLKGTNRIVIARDANGGLLTRTAGHETFHYLKENNAAKANEIGDFIINKLKEKGVDIEAALKKYENLGYETADQQREELIADSMFDVFSNDKTITELMKTDEKTACKLLDHITELIITIRDKLRVFAQEYNHAEIKALMDDAESLEKIRQMMFDGLQAVKDQKNNAANESDIEYLDIPDVDWDESDFSTKEKADNYKITESDVENLRLIGRKHISQFTNEEIKTAEKWAKKFYKDLGVKSPFFNSWIGNWRAYDTTKIKITDIPDFNEVDLKQQRGFAICNDTNWKIMISSNGVSNTQAHSGINKLSYYGLANIKGLIENAVLLDSEVHEHHTNNKPNEKIAFDHKLYSLGRESNGNIALYKMTVEEYFQDAKHTNEQRFHNLKYIEKVAEGAPGRTFSKSYSGVSIERTSATEYTVSDLFSFVNRYDEKFVFTPANPDMLNSDGTPKVFYHGTAEDFTVFKNNGSGMYFTESPDYAARYTKNNGRVMPVYLNISKPFDIIKDKTARKIFVDEYIKGGWAMGINPGSTKVDIENYIKNGIDRVEGDNLIEFLEENEYDYDGLIINEGGDFVDGKAVQRGKSYVTFKPEQIKSAANNIGTFSKYDPDITFSTKETTDGKPVVVVNDNIISNAVQDKEIISIVKKSLGRFREIPVHIHGQSLYITGQTANEYTRSKNSNYLYKNNRQIYDDKMRVAGHPYDIVYAITNYVNEAPNHKRKDDIVDFARGNILLDIDGRKYQAEAVIGLLKDNRCMLYDIVKMSAANFEYKNSGDHFADTADKNQHPTGNAVSAKGNISHISEDVNKNFLSEKSIGINFSIKENLHHEMNSWYSKTSKEERLADGGSFLIGRTSEVYKSIGIKDVNIYWGKSKIQKILDKHPKMTFETIKSSVFLLENPVIIMESRTRDDSVIAFGSTRAKNGNPVMISLLLDAKNGMGEVMDYGIVTSAYSRNSDNIQSLLNNSKMLFLDKKRTNSWLKALRLQLPSANQNYGSINTISYSSADVNKNFSTKESEGTKYSYDELIKKPNMKITALTESVKRLSNGRINRPDLVNDAVKNAAEVGKTNKNGNAVVYVDDVGRDVIIGKTGIRHGIDRRVEEHAPVLLHVGEILKNSICVNELVPKKENASESYILLGAARDGEGKINIASFVVNRFTNEVETIDVLYSANIKKEETADSKSRASGNALHSLTVSDISISDLLNIVKEKNPDILSLDVLNHFGLEKGDSEIAKGAMFSTKEDDNLRSWYNTVGRENIELKKIITAMGDAGYSTVIHDVEVSPVDIDKYARKVLRERKSSYDVERFKDELSTIFNFLANRAKSGDGKISQEDIESAISNMAGIAKRILEGSEYVESDSWEETADVRKLLRNGKYYITPAQKAEIEHTFGDYKTFRSLLMGNMMSLSTTDSSRMTLDEAWQEICSNAPGYFSEDTNELDMPEALVDFFERVKPKSKNLYSEGLSDLNEDSMIFASELVNGYYQMAILDNKYNQLKAKCDMKIIDMKRKTDAYKKKLKEEQRAAIQANKDDYKLTIERYKEAAEKETLRRSIQQHYGYVNTRLKRNDRTYHVLEKFKGLAKSFADAMPNEESGELSADKIGLFALEYGKLEGETVMFNEEMASRISILADSLRSYETTPKLSDLNKIELDTLNDICLHIKKIVKDENQMFADNKKGTVETYARAIHEELSERKDSKILDPSAQGLSFAVRKTIDIDGFKNGLMKPWLLVENMGKTIKDLWQNVVDGRNTHARIINESKEKLDGLKKEHGYSYSWKTHKVDYDGKKITVGQAMLMYATWKRNQGRQHMERGGVYMHYKEGGKDRIGILAVTDESMSQIESSLTKNQKNFVDMCVRFLTDDLGAERNVTSMTVYGIEEYKETYYIPISVDKNSIKQTVGAKKGESKIANQSAAHKIQENASNPVVITDFMDVVIKHIVDTANYCAYTAPLADLEKVISYKGNGNDSFMGIDSRKEIGKYHIEKFNDYVHVQKQVDRYLKTQGFLKDGAVTVYNESMGEDIEINSSGIKETLGSGDNFQKLPHKKKELKIALIEQLPELIKNSKVLSVDNKNYHKDNSGLTYAYFETTATIDGVDYEVKFDIRQSPQKNKFWVHRVSNINIDGGVSTSGSSNMTHRHSEPPAVYGRNNNTVIEQSQEEFSVIGDIKRKCGHNAWKQFEQLIRDVDAGVQKGDSMKPMQKLMSHYVKSSIIGNFSVVIQQPTSIFRAWSVIQPKYFLDFKEAFKPIGKYKEMKKWCPGVILAKEIGMFDVGIGRNITDYINGDTDAKIFEAIGKRDADELKMGLGKQAKRYEDFMSLGASGMDAATWCTIWQASKNKAKAENPQLVGDELMKKAAQIFEKCIDETQVYDSVFSKSGWDALKSIKIDASFANRKSKRHLDLSRHDDTEHRSPRLAQSREAY